MLYAVFATSKQLLMNKDMNVIPYSKIQNQFCWRERDKGVDVKQKDRCQQEENTI